FGDAPPLTPVENFYQRMLAGDASEVVDQAEQFLKTNSLIDYYDQVALQALLMAQVDLGRGVLDELRQRRIKETIEEVIEDLSDHDEPLASAPAPQAPPSNAVLKSAGSSPSETASVELAPLDMGRTDLAPGRQSQKPILCIAGRSFLDEAAAALLAQILGRHGIEAKVEPARPPSNGQIPRLSSDDEARMVCLSYLDADLSPAGARFAVRRLRRRLGQVKIVGGFWRSGAGQASELCAATKADFCATSFKDAVALCLHAATKEAKAEAGAIDTKPAAKSFADAAEG
ncbi:MAG: AI-2E family transporter, partial [Methylocella sp.]